MADTVQVDCRNGSQQAGCGILRRRRARTWSMRALVADIVLLVQYSRL